MQLETKCLIDVPNVPETVAMTPAELLKFHDDLTKFINDNWEALKEKDDEDEDAYLDAYVRTRRRLI